MSVDKLNKLLPQTQCGECGFDGCKPYAEAMLNKEATIDLCPPGGLSTLHALATELNQDPTPYEANVLAQQRPPSTVTIREAECIGCTKCIQACPVDAIIGSNKTMHTIVESLCTGCNLCIEPCPVDCIEVKERPALDFDKEAASARFYQRKQRLEKESKDKRSHYQQSRQLDSKDDTKAKQDFILSIIKRKQQGS